MIRKHLLLFFGILLFLINSICAQTPSEPIEIKNGLGIYFTQNGKKLSIRKLIAITKVNSEAIKEIKKAKINYEASQLFGVPGGFLLGFMFGRMAAGRDPNFALLGIGGGLFAISIPFSITSTKQAKKGVLIYNEGLKSADIRSVDFNFGLTQHGIGLKMTF